MLVSSAAFSYPRYCYFSTSLRRPPATANSQLHVPFCRPTPYIEATNAGVSAITETTHQGQHSAPLDITSSMQTEQPYARGAQLFDVSMTRSRFVLCKKLCIVLDMNDVSCEVSARKSVGPVSLFSLHRSTRNLTTSTCVI
ncbi:hypothetical protein V1523DRAFT_404771 [Lipomyces doorenjongii]